MVHVAGSLDDVRNGRWRWLLGSVGQPMHHDRRVGRRRLGHRGGGQAEQHPDDGGRDQVDGAAKQLQAGDPRRDREGCHHGEVDREADRHALQHVDDGDFGPGHK